MGLGWNRRKEPEEPEELPVSLDSFGMNQDQLVCVFYHLMESEQGWFVYEETARPKDDAFTSDTLESRMWRLSRLAWGPFDNYHEADQVRDHMQTIWRQTTDNKLKDLLLPE